MPELPDFNVPGTGKTLSQIRQDTWDKLQDPKYQKQLVLVTVSIGNNKPPFLNKIMGNNSKFTSQQVLK